MARKFTEYHTHLLVYSLRNCDFRQEILTASGFGLGERIKLEGEGGLWTIVAIRYPTAFNGKKDLDTIEYGRLLPYKEE